MKAEDLKGMNAMEGAPVSKEDNMTETEKARERLARLASSTSDGYLVAVLDAYGSEPSGQFYDDLRAALTAWNTRPSVGEPVACGMCSEPLGPELTHCPLGLESAEDDVKAQCGYRNPPPPLYARPGVVPDREGVARIVFKAMYWARRHPRADAVQVAIREGVAADAILSLLGGGGVPAGYKLVPVEPTEAMLRAWLAEEYRQCTGPNPDPAKCYAAMLSVLEG
jgi:hypothetical protein